MRFRNTPTCCLLIVALLTTVWVSANITLHSCIITTVAAGKPITDSLQLIYPPLQKLPADLKENPKYCCVINYPTEFLFSLSYILVCFCFTLLSSSDTCIHTDVDLDLWLEVKTFFLILYSSSASQPFLLQTLNFGLACPSGLIILFLINIPWISYWPLLSSPSFSPSSVREKMPIISISLLLLFSLLIALFPFACYSFSHPHKMSCYLEFSLPFFPLEEPINYNMGLNPGSLFHPGLFICLFQMSIGNRSTW